MGIKKLIKASFLELLPVIVMIALIPVIKNDFLLSALYIIFIIFLFRIKYEKNETIIFFASLILMAFFEFIFISTGVETFNRNSLFGIMPLWLPILWGYGLVAGKRIAFYINKLK